MYICFGYIGMTIVIKKKSIRRRLTTYTIIKQQASTLTEKNMVVAQRTVHQRKVWLLFMIFFIFIITILILSFSIVNEFKPGG